MGAFKQLQRKSSTGSLLASPSSSFLRAPRQFAPQSAVASEQSPSPQDQFDNGSSLKYSLERIPILPSDSRDASGQKAGQLGEAPSIVYDVLRSPGRPLAADMRTLMEARLGYDFSQVRIHTDAQAAASAKVINAQAYTVGSNVVFGAGRYAPETYEGKMLMAHELSHVVQQQNTPGILQGKLRIGSPSDRAELAADAAARTVLLPENIPYRSSAPQIRYHLRSSSLPSTIIQRAVETWGGEFDTDIFEFTKKTANNGVKMDGVKMQLRFVPNEQVDAELIGMVQTSRSLYKGSPIPASAFSPKKAKQEALESFRIPAGEANAGTMIDQRPGQPNPLYASDKGNIGSTSYALEDTGWHSGFGRPGWRYIRDGVPTKHDPLLKDEPRLPSVFENGTPVRETSQVFETTALAIKGAQEGTFYGSVEWGWKKNAEGEVEKIPLKLVSKDVPSRVFAKASARWNKTKTSKGEEHIQLPTGMELYTNTRDVELIGDRSQLPKGSRLGVLDKRNAEPINKLAGKDTRWKVIVLTGNHKGKVGRIRTTDLVRRPYRR